MLETVFRDGPARMPCKFHQQVLFLYSAWKSKPDQKSVLLYNRSCVCLILLIKEKDRSASALDISNVQPTTSRKWMFGKESLSHAPKAARTTTATATATAETTTATSTTIDNIYIIYGILLLLPLLEQLLLLPEQPLPLVLLEKSLPLPLLER